jgi:cation transport ATPase
MIALGKDVVVANLKKIHESVLQLLLIKPHEKVESKSNVDYRVDKIFWRYEGGNERHQQILQSIASQSSHSFIKPITQFLNAEKISHLKLEDYTSYPDHGESAICSGILFFIGKRDLIKSRNILIDQSLQKKVKQSTSNSQKLLYFSDFIEVLAIITISEKA